MGVFNTTFSFSVSAPSETGCVKRRQTNLQLPDESLAKGWFPGKGFSMFLRNKYCSLPKDRGVICSQWSRSGKDCGTGREKWSLWKRRTLQRISLWQTIVWHENIRKMKATVLKLFGIDAVLTKAKNRRAVKPKVAQKVSKLTEKLPSHFQQSAFVKPLLWDILRDKTSFLQQRSPLQHCDKGWPSICFSSGFAFILSQGNKFNFQENLSSADTMADHLLEGNTNCWQELMLCSVLTLAKIHPGSSQQEHNRFWMFGFFYAAEPLSFAVAQQYIP